MKNEVTQNKKTPTAAEVEIAAFEEKAEELNGLSLTLDVPPARRMFVLAKAMNDLDEALTPEVMRPIMSLMGSRVGYLTDRDKPKDGKPQKPYDEVEVKEVVKEAILCGAYMTNNEVNIIAGAMYTTKNHFIRKVREIPGLTDLVVGVGTPHVLNGETKVKCTAKWNLHGKEQSIGLDEKMPCIFTIKVNSYMGPDAVVGKATRKLYKKIYETATGSEISIPDGDIADMAKDTDARVVDQGQVNLDDITPGDPSEHSAVDEPQPSPEEGDTLSPEAVKMRDSAYDFLSARYDVAPDQVDALLKKQGQPCMLDIKRDTADPDQIAALITVHKKLSATSK